MTFRVLLCATAAILLFGLATAAGAQPDSRAPEGGSAKQPTKAVQVAQQRLLEDPQPTQLQQQHERGDPQGPQRQQPGDRQPQQRQQPRHRQPQPAQPMNRPQRPSDASRPAQAMNRPQRPSDASRPAQAMNRPQRPSDAGRQAQPSPSYSHRRAPAGNPAQSQRMTSRRLQSQAPYRGPRQWPAAPVRNRMTARESQGVPTSTRPRTVASRVEQQTMWPRFRAQAWRSQHRTWVQRGGYDGYRIPSRQFSLYFGRPHRYHFSSFQVRVFGAYPQFYADGFWFTLLDPVPEYWGDDWYETDYVTIVEFGDGYYILDEAYPDALLAISVQMP